MSKRSKIVEKILEKNHREYMDDADVAEEHLKERSAVEDETYKIPKKPYHTNVESKNLFGCQMLTFNDVEDAERMVIYIHGGAYVNENQTAPHFLLRQTCKKNQCMCILSDIPSRSKPYLRREL